MSPSGKGRRRTCEECGRPIESRDPDVFLCRICSRGLEEERQAARKERQQRLRAARQKDVWPVAGPARRPGKPSRRNRFED